MKVTTGSAICIASTAEGSKYCNECKWKEEEREKKKNEAAHSNPAGSDNDHTGYS